MRKLIVEDEPCLAEAVRGGRRLEAVTDKAAGFEAGAAGGGGG